MRNSQRGAFFYELAIAMTVILPALTGLVNICMVFNHSVELLDTARLMDRSVRHALRVSAPGERCSAVTLAIHTVLQNAHLSLDSLALENLDLPQSTDSTKFLGFRLAVQSNTMPVIGESMTVPTAPVIIAISPDASSELSTCDL